MLPTQLDCPFCHAPLNGDLLVRATDTYSDGMHLYTSRCPNCATPIEYTAASGHVDVGYTYWAGSMHFESMARLPVAGLREVGPGVLKVGSDTVYPAAQVAEPEFGAEVQTELAELI